MLLGNSSPPDPKPPSPQIGVDAQIARQSSSHFVESIPIPAEQEHECFQGQGQGSKKSPSTS